MHCPFCRHADTRVADSRASEDGSTIRRRRVCNSCERKFSTIEQVLLTVVKRSGVKEPFSRDKVIKGVSKACQGRPVTQDQLAALGQEVEEALRSSGSAEIPAEQVGVAILKPLANLDAVAYLRFASVYKNFDSLDDFARELELLKRAQGAQELPIDVPKPRSRTKREETVQEPLIG